MFKSVLSGFSKIATPQRILILIIFLVLAWLLLSYSGAKGLALDTMETGSPESANVESATVSEHPLPGSESASVIKPTANPSDLLPADQNSQWASLNPVNMNQGSILAGDMLQAGYHIGLDTIGQTMKNANLQLRSDPIIPKQEVGPWNQSTYEGDYMRVPLELGVSTSK